MNTWPITISLPQGLTIGGVTSWAVRLAESLARLGYRVRLVAHAHAGDARGAIVPQGGVEVLHAPRLADGASWTENVSLYRSLAPQVLLPNLLDDSFAIAAALAAVMPEQSRVVAWNHSDNPYDYAHLSYYEPLVHQYVCVSQRCLRELRHRLPHRDDDIALLPYGIPDPGLQRRAPLGDRPIRLLYAGRLEQTNKRVLHLVELARRLDQQAIAFELRLIGEGPQKGVLEDRIQRLQERLVHRGNQIRLEAPVDFRTMTEHWRWADVALLASAFEGFSVAMLEAMMAGCIPLVSRVRSGVDDIIADGQNGLTFPVDDLDAFTQRVIWITQHPGQAEALAHNARAAALRVCDYAAYVERVRQIIASATHAHARPWPRSRPIGMHGDLITDPTTPSDATERLRRVLDRIAAEAPGPVAIFGAGRHTRALAAALAETSLDIRCVVDEAPERWGRTLWGWPIVPAEHVPQLGVRHVVISSFLHESNLWTRFRESFDRQGIALHRLYAADANGGAEERRGAAVASAPGPVRGERDDE
jgi:glycosyltransferase involved in cell wall biosynthesis